MVSGMFVRFVTVTVFLSISLTLGRRLAKDKQMDMTKAYATFRAKHGRSENSPHRLALFAKRHAEVLALNSRSRKSWVAKVNQFADYTDAEFKALLGHRRMSLNSGGSEVEEEEPTSFLQMSTELNLARAMDWRPRLNSSDYVKNQGDCGSCWAAATAGVLEMHAELHMKSHPDELSFKQLVDCVPNPQHCGGTGGCDGATAELAFAYVQKHGLLAADTYGGDINHNSPCQAPSLWPPSASYLQVEGFERLPQNKLRPLMAAVAQKGPVVVAADATNWGPYGGGIFDSCSPDAVVNHAVVMLGYGHDKDMGLDYWLIRNSWGREWGEKGYIRVLRHSTDEGDAGYCGIDKEPEQGVWCMKNNTMKEMPVCGMCGILADSSLPKKVTFRPSR
eukprot:TRINITY_DN65381_c0_g1_i1.p1 TRINITY_DN65381_c0_g1~~TRINITY_DN65381_c0_g1_i1.p1  ORF type:complete len:391 (-),score=88.21 TRINITY_DN65381_c0_g1_i1:71-1243(-)